MSLRFEVSQASVDALESNTRAAFEKVIRNKELLNDIGETIITDIKFQTRRGNSIPGKSKLKPLTSKWIEKRRSIDEAQNTGQAFSPRRSNLTASGQLLESLKHKIVGAGKVIVDATGSRIPYFYTTKRKGIQQRKKKHEPTNEELAEYVAEQGRPFLGIRDAIRDRIKRQVVAFIRRSSRVLNLISKNK
jgi:hypothetical protein